MRYMLHKNILIYSKNIYLNQVNTDKQAPSSDIPNALVPSCQLFELHQQIVANLHSILHQLILLDDVKNSVANGTADRVAAISVEIFYS